MAPSSLDANARQDFRIDASPLPICPMAQTLLDPQ
jgi:hypothetical protein